MKLYKQILITRSSASYRYCTWLRRLWGISSTESITLCAFFHNIFWLSLASIASSPIWAFGWLFIKSSRSLFVFLEKFKIGRKINDFAKKTGWINKLDEIVDLMHTSPLEILTLWGVGAVAIIVICICLSALIGMFIPLIPEIPVLILHGLLYSGFGIFYMFFGIGWLVVHIGWSFKWIYINLLIPLCYFLSQPVVWYWIGISFSIIIFILGFLYLAFKLIISENKLVERIVLFMQFVLNGFNKTLEKATNRWEVISQEKEASLKMSESRHLYFENTFTGKICLPVFRSVIWLFGGIGSVFGSIKSLFITEVESVDGKIVRILGFFGILWYWFKALKYNTCPMISFVDDVDEIKADFYIFETILGNGKKVLTGYTRAVLDKQIEKRYRINAFDDESSYLWKLRKSTPVQASSLQEAIEIWKSTQTKDD